jgi:hypothetical protein
MLNVFSQLILGLSLIGYWLEFRLIAVVNVAAGIAQL